MTGSGPTGPRLEWVHDAVARHVAMGAVPGAVTLISRKGQVYADAIGNRVIGGPPMRRDTIFRIASMTKPIAAAAAMTLVEEGRMTLDEPVDRLLPELAGRRVLRRIDGMVDDTVPADRPITLRDLLTMRMGLGLLADAADYPIQKAIRELGVTAGHPKPPITLAPDAWLRRIGQLPLMYQPGERWLYRDAFQVLGVLIARAAGQPLETVLRTRLFDRLGMKDTGFTVPAAKRDRLAACYRIDPSTGGPTLLDDPEDSLWSRDPIFPSASSGLVSTVDDYLAFGRMLLDRGRGPGGPVLSPSSVALMVSDQITPAQKAASDFGPGFWDSRGWGFGLSVITKQTRGAARPGSFGWGGSYGTAWASDPTEDLVAILMTQRHGLPEPGGIEADFWSAVYRAIDDGGDAR